MKADYSIIWANGNLSTKSSHVNAPYHFIHVGEVIDYLNKHLDSDVDLYDIEAEQMEFDKVIYKIIHNDYKAIAFYINTDNLQNTLYLHKLVKNIFPDCQTIAYGEMPLFLPEFFASTDFNALISNGCDQEVAILDFFEYAVHKKHAKQLRGVILVTDHQLHISSPGICLEPNEWGLTDIDKVPIKDYFRMSQKEQIVITLARGCPYSCAFCNATLYYGKQVRMRNPYAVIDYINHFDYTYYKFFAPNLTFNENYVFKLTKLLIQNKNKIKWSCTTRVDLLHNEELIHLMAESGCYKIAVGVESVVSDDLNRIKSGYDATVVDAGISLLNKYGIEYKALIMLGIPGQTKENIKMTLDFLSERHVTIRPTAYTPFQELTSNMSVEEITAYDKRTYYNGVCGLTYADFIKLIYDTQHYTQVFTDT